MPYLILVGDIFVGQVGDGHLIVARFADLVLGPLAGFAGVQEVPQSLVVNFNKTCSEGELRQNRTIRQVTTLRIALVFSVNDRRSALEAQLYDQ